MVAKYIPVAFFEVVRFSFGEQPGWYVLLIQTLSEKIRIKIATAEKTKHNPRFQPFKTFRSRFEISD